VTQRRQAQTEPCSELSSPAGVGKPTVAGARNRAVAGEFDGPEAIEFTSPEGCEQTVRERLNEVALERDLRPSTRIAYQRCLKQLGVDLDEPVDAVSKTRIEDAAWLLHNPNTRRGALIAARTVFGLKLRVGRSVPRRYVLPDEDTIKLALMTSPHEVRGLLMAYGGLRLGESCAITRADLNGDRLRVDKQIQCLRQTGLPTITRVAPVKATENDIVVPYWLATMVTQLTETTTPDAVRESIRRAGDRVGIKLNPSQLRHFYATHLLELGAPIALVSRQMRHSDISTTLRHYADHRADVQIHELLG
jgi:integrase